MAKWQGEKLSQLRREKLWEIVQVYPSRAHFPGGEAIRQAQARAVDALETLAIRHTNQRVAVVSHSDIIKLMVAHYLGAHLDFYQRIEISPASMIDYPARQLAALHRTRQRYQLSAAIALPAPQTGAVGCG